MHTAIIILAAGNSSRLGKPKQLLTYNGFTLLDIVIKEALKTTFRPVIVVLGAYAAEIIKSSHHPEITYVNNQEWEKGMSSSIATGLKTALILNLEIENAIIAVADQVHISSEIFETLVQTKQKSHKNIVTCAYAQTLGTPVLFNKNYFEELLKLNGQSGAKSLIQKHIDDAVSIHFEMGKIDIDTEKDYNNLINNN
ncbi:nucleotidyltransferase family protein [Pedobacter miscanthi]|jgi:molybdenum cofactor cytidylyltransferase|uniref:nucleotidyltransferase family protein n=1 Tax=Pedobacter miscanthi TaxID=2259170 RepID=UPI0029316238|nr:nucleotidyltransferase family protein [Pedobacter miscanthi]